MGFINKALVLDWETSGLIKETGKQDWGSGPQGIELGIVHVDDLMGECRVGWEFQTRVRFVQSIYPGLNWDRESEKIHGIRRTDLSGAPLPVQVCENLERLLRGSYTRNEPILLCGQTPMFDRYFWNQLFWLAQREPPRLHSRMIDTFSIGLAVWGHQNSNELFQHVTGAQRGLHNALDDARSAYQVLKLAIQQTSRNKIGFRSDHIVKPTK